MRRAFVNSLPKSGTNLLAKCLNLLGYRERGHLGAGVILDRNLMANLRRLRWTPRRPGYLLGINTPVEVPRSGVDRRIRALRDGEFLTAHVGYTGDLLHLSLNAGCAVVLVIRDPRAVMASFVPYCLSQPRHHLSKVFATMTESERYRSVLHGYFGRTISLQPMRTCMLALDPYLRSEQVHVVRFEDLVGESGGGSHDTQVETLRQLCQFLDAMPGDLEKTAAAIFGRGRHTFRKGQIDSWREEIPPDVMPEIERELAALLAEWQYPD